MKHAMYVFESCRLLQHCMERLVEQKNRFGITSHINSSLQRSVPSNVPIVAIQAMLEERSAPMSLRKFSVRVKMVSCWGNQCRSMAVAGQTLHAMCWVRLMGSYTRKLKNVCSTIYIEFSQSNEQFGRVSDYLVLVKDIHSASFLSSLSTWA